MRQRSIIIGSQARRMNPHSLARKLAAGLPLFVLASACEPAPDENASPAPSPTPVPVWQYPAPEAVAEPPVLAISDGGNFRVLFVRADTREVFYQLKLKEAFPECGGMGDLCTLTEIHHQLIDGHDYLDLNLSNMNPANYDFSPGFVRRVRLADPVETVFTLSHFDFSAIPYGQDICSYQADDPCGTGFEAACGIGFPHDVEVVRDDPANHYVELLITDMLTQRIMKVNFDYSNGNTCGKVEWMLDKQSSPDFGDLYLPNDADLLDVSGRQYLLTSFYSTTTLAGQGFLRLWERDTTSGTWQIHWTYPPQTEEAQTHYLNSPHGPSLLPEADGSYRLIYGHSRGDADGWGVGFEGSIGTAHMDALESAPTYVHDELFPTGHPLTPMGFVRDVTPTDDGQYLVTDSGCLDPFGCPLPGRVYLYAPSTDTAMVPGLDGSWAANHALQNLLTIDMQQLDPFLCGISTTYESDFLPFSSLGDGLLAHLDDAISTCAYDDLP